jgi:squalene-hopene/tetraprenyl-beta-curcumene cyclase
MIANKDGGVSRRDPGHPARTFSPSSRPSAESLHGSVDASRRWLLEQQHPDGFWVGELEGDTILESEYILLLAFLGREHEDVCVKAARYIYEHQRPEGGWAIYPGGPLDLSASVKAYFALKLVGVAPADPVMVRAREAILAEGGAQQCNSFTRFYLALLGQIPMTNAPACPRR